MKPKFKEDAKEFRKAGLLGCLGLGIFSSILRWRRVLPVRGWEVVLGVLAVVAVTALIKPGLFRGFYRFSHRLSYLITEVLGRIALAFIFIVVVTPLGLLMRMTGKDPLRLRRLPEATTYWRPAPKQSAHDRLF